MKIIPLWEQTPRAMEGCELPSLVYYPAAEKTHRSTFVIFPGGAYLGRAPHEGEGYARYLNEAGYDAFVCEYRISPYRHPCALLDARRGVRYVRAHAAEFGIDPDKIAVMGSSAGGNLAAILCTCVEDFPEEHTDAVDEQPYMPNAQILCYPYISFSDPKLRIEWCADILFGENHATLAEALSPEEHIHEHTPQAFFFHTFMDDVVHIEHSLKYAARMRDMKIPCEMHIFPAGPHGLGLAEAGERCNPHVAQWGPLLLEWLAFIGF